jgi:hypothetical protein
MTRNQIIHIVLQAQRLNALLDATKHQTPIKKTIILDKPKVKPCHGIR